jgi:hypothetical protein
VGAHLEGGEAQDVFANGGDAVSDPMQCLFRSDQADGAVGAAVGAYWGIVGGAGEGSDAMNDGRPGDDWAENGVAGAVHGYDGIAVVVLLEFEGDGDAVGEMKGGVGVEELEACAEKTEIA